MNAALDWRTAWFEAIFAASMSGMTLGFSLLADGLAERFGLRQS